MALGTHAGKLDRWLGAEKVEKLSASMRDWYGPPILVSGVPGKVYAHKGGDFRGSIKAGAFAGAYDAFESLYARVSRNSRRMAKGETLFTGFSSFSDLLAEATAGKRNYFPFQKTGVSGVIGFTNTLWFVGAQPAAGASAAAAPGGTAWTSASQGAFSFANPSNPDTQHLICANVLASQSAQQLLLYDRLFSATKTMSNNGTETVSGVPTRYQSATPGAQDSAEGNFLIIECRTVLSGTAHNWATVLYLDQLGNSSTLPSVTGTSTCPASRLDMPIQTWFCPLATSDTGIGSLTQMQCSSNAVTGAIDFTIGHPLAWIPCPVANTLTQIDFVNNPFSLPRIFDDACLAMLEVTKGVATATTFSGDFHSVAG